MKNNIADLLFIAAMVCFGISIIFSIWSCYISSDMCKYRGYMRRKDDSSSDKRRI